MQCVFATPFLNDFFLNEYKSCTPLKGGRLSKEYYNLVLMVKKAMSGEGSTSGYGDTSTVTPSRLKEEVSRVASQFSGYGQ